MKYIRLIIFSIFIISSISVYSQSEKDTPRNGEGILAFLRRNKRTGAENLNTFLELNKGKFGKENSLLKDVSYLLPDTDKDNTNKTESEVLVSGQTGKKTENKLFGEKFILGFPQKYSFLIVICCNSIFFKNSIKNFY